MSVDPLSALVVAFLTAMAQQIGSAAGSRIANALFPRVQEAGAGNTLRPFAEGRPPSPDEEERIRRIVASLLANSPALADELQGALDSDSEAYPSVAHEVEARYPSYWAAWKRLSPQMKKVKGMLGSPKCPVGGEWMMGVMRFYRGDGTPIRGWDYLSGNWARLPKSAVAQCPSRKHTWPVFE